MIYIIKKQDNYIYVTHERHNLDEDTTSELLLTFDWPGKEKVIIEENLRPWKDLKFLGVRFKNKPEVLEVIQSHPTTIPRQQFIYRKEVESTLSDASSCLNFLSETGLVDKDSSISVTADEILERALYDCDIMNIISEDLDEETFDVLERFMDLRKNERELVIEFYKCPSKTERINSLREIVTMDADKVLPFIPTWYKTNMRLFGFNQQSGLDTCGFSKTPEYKDSEILDENSKVIENPDFFIRKEVYQIFHLDEVWKGRDIKARFREIYEKLGTQRSSRVHDIFRYFDTAITRNGYRLISRKII